MTSELTAINVTRGTSLAHCARVADTASARMIGLLHDTMLAEGDGLWIVPCNSIHSFWMKFVFDAVFLDKKLRVVHLVREMKPWRISKIVLRAHSVLELPAGLITRTQTEIGDQFEMKRD
ncbi:MAG TPA: DUF192 domain-containing protein [Candidatus Methylacidiphilales bacterium]|jgi:hypothetical protein|nr:DUF192 domain-containing protein [Candidatus Methylacidiphilales bacterium]